MCTLLDSESRKCGDFADRFDELERSAERILVTMSFRERVELRFNSNDIRW